MDFFKSCAVSELYILNATSPVGKSGDVPGRPFHSLTYRYAGRISLECEDLKLISEPDSITFMPKGRSYRTQILEDTHIIAVHFQLTEEFDSLLPFVIHDVGTTELKRLFEVLTEISSPSVQKDFLCMSIFYRILAELQFLMETLKPIPKIARLVKERIDRDFSDPALSISLLASEQKTSESYLRRVFKNAYGMSPMDYLIQVRIQHAKSLLETSFDTVAEISEKCGYTESSYFIKVFRAHTGQTPHQYRKNTDFFPSGI